MLPNKSTGGLFVTAKIKALALIKANAVYAVSCYIGFYLLILTIAGNRITANGVFRA